MKSFKTRQEGMSAFGITIIIIIVSFMALMGLKLFPVYFESFKVNSILETLDKDDKASDLTGKAIKDTIMRRFSIDNVDNVKREHINIKKEKNELIVMITYDVKQHFVGNIDFLVTFEKEAKLGGR